MQLQNTPNNDPTSTYSPPGNITPPSNGPASPTDPNPSPTPATSPLQPGQSPANKPTVSVAAVGKKLPKIETFKSIMSTILILLIAPLLALAITAYLFQSYEVDGPSMQTTLENHDRLIIWKAPKTLSKLTGNTYVPHRGDVIVFVKKGLYDFDSSKEKQLIKRVVALPGERVVVKDNLLTIYNNANPNGFSPDKTMSYGKVIGDTSGNVDITVPPGEIFVCGDNRPNSLDSRTSLSDQVQDEVKKHFGDKVFDVVIPRNVRLAEAPSFGKPISEHDKWSKGARAYKQLAKEVEKRVSKQQ